MGKLLSNPKVLFAAVIAVAILFTSVLGGALGASFGLGFLGGPIPLIQLPAEYIVEIGSYQLMNTFVMFWLAILVIVILVFLGTRNIREVPGRWQGIFEAFFEFFIDLAEKAGGGRKGRMFLPVVTTIFLGVLFSNWLGTVPGVGNIGRIETVEEFFELKLKKEFQAEGDSKLAKELKKKGFVEFFETYSEDSHVAEALSVFFSEHGEDKLIIFSGQSGVGFITPGRGEQWKVRLNQIVEQPSDLTDHDQLETFIQQVEEPRVLAGVVPDEEQEWTAQDVEDGRVGLLVPFFRGASTDLNTTLAIAIFAMVSVQVWGFSTLGFRGYAGKFIINPIKDPIGSILGVLEMFLEFVKVVSFTFRLFGNMFAGEVLLIAMGFLLPLIGIIPFLGLELFVGVIQAIIFSVLTLMFGALAVIAHDHGDHDEEGHEAHAPEGAEAH